MSASKTKWVRLGDYIELCNERNDRGLYGPSDVMGMTITKEIIPTKAHVKDTELSKFLVVHPKEFVYNPRTHGKKIGLGYNQTNKPFLISWNNIAFKVKNTGSLFPDYLYMLICRDEWDRNACFRSWGSSTEVFSWTEFGLMEIPLPLIEVQRELVDTYNGLKAIAEQNEALVASLSKMCEALVIEVGKEHPHVRLGNHIVQVDERNTLGKYKLADLKGISTDKIFIPTKANMDGVSLTNYKVVNPRSFTYVADTSRRGNKIALALNNSDKPVIISSIYTTFESKDLSQLLPEYLFLLLSRSEFDRYSRFNSWGSARETFDWQELCRVQIPLPSIEAQQSIVNLYHCMEEAKSIATTAREKLKTICPALVLKGANATVES